jgi:hypothetical protein
MPANAENVMDDRRTIVRTCLTELGPSSRLVGFSKSDFQSAVFLIVLPHFGAEYGGRFDGCSLPTFVYFAATDCKKSLTRNFFTSTGLCDTLRSAATLQNPKKQTQNPPPSLAYEFDSRSRHHYNQQLR